MVIATLRHESQVISLLFPCSSLFRILPFRHISLLVLTFLQILDVAPPPFTGICRQGKATGITFNVIVQPPPRPD